MKLEIEKKHSRARAKILLVLLSVLGTKRTYPRSSERTRERSGERSRGAEVGEQEFWRSWRSICKLCVPTVQL